MNYLLISFVIIISEAIDLTRKPSGCNGNLTDDDDDVVVVEHSGEYREKLNVKPYYGNK